MFCSYMQRLNKSHNTVYVESGVLISLLRCIRHIQSVFYPLWQQSVVCGLCQTELRVKELSAIKTPSSWNVFIVNTVRPRFSQLRTTGIPAIRNKTARNGFLTMHFTPLIRIPRCPAPTRKFRNGYVKSVEKNSKPDYNNCHLWSRSHFLRMSVTVAERAWRS